MDEKLPVKLSGYAKEKKGILFRLLNKLKNNEQAMHGETKDKSAMYIFQWK